MNHHKFSKNILVLYTNNLYRRRKIIFNYYFCCSVYCFEFVMKAIKFKRYLLDILLKWTKIIETIHVTYKNISCSLWIFSWMTASIENILLCPIMGYYLTGLLSCTMNRYLCQLLFTFAFIYWWIITSCKYLDNS